MAGATLRLGAREETKTPPEHGPEFNADAHFAEVCGITGVRYVQGKALFNVAKKYVRPAPPEMCLAPLTAEQEKTRRNQIIANKKFFGAATAQKVANASMPQAIVQAERENARARAAESQAA